MNLSTRQLRAFIALAERRNFTRAAAHLHLSQPAFSELIRSLEQTVGARLFDRNTRSVEMTPEGKLFGESAQRLMTDLTKAIDDVRNHAFRRKGRVLLAAPPSLAAGLLPVIFAKFRSSYPEIELDLLHATSDACADMVRDGRAELALVTSETDRTGLITELLLIDQFHLVYHRDHQIAQQKQVLLKDLALYPFVSFHCSSSIRRHVEAAVRPQKMCSVLEVDHLATVAAMVENGMGIGAVPGIALLQFRSKNLAIRPLHCPELKFQVFIVRNKDRAQSAAARSMHELILRHNWELIRDGYRSAEPIELA